MDEQQLRKFLGKLEEQIEALTKVRDDLTGLLNSAQGTHPVKEILTHFDNRWKRAYAVGREDRYEFTNIDAATVKRWLKTADIKTITTRIDNYFNDREDWVVRQKHPFSLLTARYNRYKVDRGLHPWVGDVHDAGPVDCQHEPTCRTDAQHTEVRRREMRQ